MIFNDELREKVIEQCSKQQNLLAVSKTKPLESIKEAYRFGQRDFGENKVQELLEKSHNLEGHNDIKWHFIGKLQTNKINLLLKVRSLVSIHSIDSCKLLDKLLSKNIDRKIGLFIQVNTSLEEEKSGFSIDENFKTLIEKIESHSHFYHQGFMTIGKIRSGDFFRDAERSFKTLKKIRDQFAPQSELSMGMSQDYELALKYESNWVRIGSALFGQRG